MRRLLFVFVTIGLLGHAVPSASAKDAVKIKKTVFAREITDKFEAKGVTTRFNGKETVWILATIKGRPKSGIIESRWTFRGDEIGRAKVDVASVNKGLLFSFGEDTFAKFNLTPNADGLPIGNSYLVELLVNGVSTGTYPFEIVPPTGAIASKVTKVATTVTAGGAPKKTFAPTDTVYLSFTGDFGLATWLEARWNVAGKLDPNGTRSLTLQENKQAVDGNFSFLPAGGWPKGSHSVTLTMNDRRIGTYTFTIA